MTISETLGVAATGLVIAGYMPQIAHLIRQRCTAGLSIPAFSMWCAASALFLIHAVLIGDRVFLVVQVVNLSPGAVIVVCCRRYQGHLCPFHRQLFTEHPAGVPPVRGNR
jgi:uncharacterized protein with PQ loop repeat